jgi:uncharacterized damage-inducible protein DinB
MTESKRIPGLFEDLYSGNPWIEITIAETLADINTAEASQRIRPEWHTIQELVHHLACWRENVLQRIQGEVIKTPAHNYFKTDPKENWSQLRQRLAGTQVAWLSFLQKMPAPNMALVYPGNGLDYYAHIHGILQHDAYHLGQIVLLAKSIRLKAG